MSKRRKAPTRRPPVEWGEWFRCDHVRDHLGQSVPIPANVETWRNSLYTVSMRVLDGDMNAGGGQWIEAPPEGWPRMLWLSIKRNDRKPIGDWRVLQRIKNEMVSPDAEAVELYPAEDRLVDTSNQYHLWCLEPGHIFPFGYRGREVLGAAEAAAVGAVQRPFDVEPAPSTVDMEAMLEVNGYGPPPVVDPPPGRA